MLMRTTGVSPRDRRIGRGKVALAALAAILCSATTARANLVDFVIVQAQSSLKQVNKIYGPAVGNQTTTAQVAGSDTAPLYGHIYVDLNPGTIKLTNSSAVNFVTTGNYAPHDPVTSDPLGPPPVGTTPGNYGLAAPGIGLSAVQHNLKSNFSNTLLGPISDLPLGGTNFPLASTALEFTQGRQAFVTVLGNGTDDVVGSPIFASGYFNDITSTYTPGAGVGTWDGTTLTIPIDSKLTFRITNDFGGIDEDVVFTGQIVAVPFVPEPSTVTLLGFGVVGLLSYAWRARKRKNLVA